jgi:hypothetical protein
MLSYFLLADLLAHHISLLLYVGLQQAGVLIRLIFRALPLQVEVGAWLGHLWVLLNQS